MLGYFEYFMFLIASNILFIIMLADYKKLIKNT